MMKIPISVQSSMTMMVIMMCNFYNKTRISGVDPGSHIEQGMDLGSRGLEHPKNLVLSSFCNLVHFGSLFEHS